MSIDSLTFRTALSALAAGVCVVTARNKEINIGITVSSLTSLSLKPPLVLFCLDNASKSRIAFAKGKKFAVNILCEDQKPVAQFFARPDKNNWSGISFKPDKNKIALLNDTLASLSCIVVAQHNGGDHTIIIGKVEAIKLGNKNGKPLLYFQRDYRGLGKKKL